MINKHHRRSIRLKGFDYAQAGAYFVTVCTHNRACLFGDEVRGEIRLNGAGRLVQSVWGGLPDHYPYIDMDAFVIMPNHVHGIVWLKGSDNVGATGAGLKPAPTVRHGLPEIVRAFKTFSARQINAMRSTFGISVWQRNYFEHIIRNDETLQLIRKYIADNPARWAEDVENPSMNTHKGHVDQL